MDNPTVQESANQEYRNEQEIAYKNLEREHDEEVGLEVEQSLRERDDEYLRDAMQEMI